ncbi:16S rRNA (guanine(527)-N(7))-methyltransferase RsmG [soil metagenome]
MPDGPTAPTFHVKHPPAAARSLLGDRTDDLLPYAGWLATAAIERGLLGPREGPRLWERHLLNCAAVAGAVPRAADVVDIGSGAGLPGLVWAVLRPDLQITVVDPLLRRVAFLDEVIASLRLPNVHTRRARAQDLSGVVSADVVASRAVAPLTKLADWCLPLVRPGGAMWAMKGRSAEQEMLTAMSHLQRAGAGETVLGTYGEGVLNPPARVVHVRVPSA